MHYTDINIYIYILYVCKYREPHSLYNIFSLHDMLFYMSNCQGQSSCAAKLNVFKIFATLGGLGGAIHGESNKSIAKQYGQFIPFRCSAPDSPLC